MIHDDILIEVKKYLEQIHGAQIIIEYIGPLEKDYETEESIKEFNYGKTILIEFSSNGKKKQQLLSTMKRNIFGHQHFYDRAKSLLLDHSCFNKLPKHVKSIDVGVYTKSGEFKSLGESKEFFILREKVEGKEYFLDLERIKEEDTLTKLDFKRAEALANYLVEIHSVKNNEKSLYTRRIRELMGHGECIMGLIDSYPKGLNFTNYNELKQIEMKCVEWRYKIKDKTHRLSQVHGDFHPWNILFRKNTDFTVLDRSRGEWGEPADDIACMTINYLFYSLQQSGQIRGVFLQLFKFFWEKYLKKTGDEEVFSIIAPFYAWRALVLASPLWYPDLRREIRRKLFNFIHNILSSKKLELNKISKMFE